MVKAPKAPKVPKMPKLPKKLKLPKITAITKISLDKLSVRQVSIIGGTNAITQTCCADSARFNDVGINGPLGVALQLEYGLIHPATSNVTVTGGTGGVGR